MKKMFYYVDEKYIQGQIHDKIVRVHRLKYRSNERRGCKS